jgi:hypothetical protein
MVYPIFEINSIVQRFNFDIKGFETKYSETDDTDLKLISDEISLNSTVKLLSAISPITEYIDNRLNGNYVDEISHIEGDLQNQLWIARTYLFYQLLIFETVILKNERLYNEVFSDLAIFPFREDIVSELPNFKMGIFGDIKPTSDIDVGVNYSGNTLSVPGLAYIVSRFECLFIIYTKKTRGSLAYDIETYADMFLLPNSGEDRVLYPNYFYLDSSLFTENNFRDMLVCAGKSIVRNVLIAYKDLHKDVNLDDITFANVQQNNIFSQSLFDVSEDLPPLLNDVTWFNSAKTDVYEFLNMPYEKQRYAYYAKVKVAEAMKFEKTKNLESLTSDDICAIMKLIGDALTYRMESYTCSPTVVHVVRILQASKDQIEKYKTLVPKEYCQGEIQHLDPFCSIGKYGYILSALEQMGYAYRFYLTYCQKDNSHYDYSKCARKQGKYMERYDNALFYILKLKKQIAGRKKKSNKKSKRRRIRKTKRTKRTKRTRRVQKY